MTRPILVVMAAGMGSRYGGLKQIDSVGPQGEVILDYSLYDARRAGFETVVFIIKPDIEEIFKQKVGNRIGDFMEVRYAFQELTTLPNPYQLPPHRQKPWGTAHAVWCASEQIDAPFAVINADDFYGYEAFKLMFDYLEASVNSHEEQYAMVGYQLDRTMSENGAVSRGLCQVDEEHFLQEIEEQTQIEWFDDRIRYTEDGVNWVDVDSDTIVSMNLWGFPSHFPKVIDRFLGAFLERAIRSNPLKGEYYLPSVVRKQLRHNEAKVKVLKTDEQWFGVTYTEDKPLVQEKIQTLVANGVYPSPLWSKEN
ncbi:sugar phosphate nucleotidyltransferase [Aerococcaceae bacterium NML191292]|nr:sugar phosphate nucleotidyltransferase [Aerococcaceae bacterium NML191292]MCW6662583.1 sugar phosphate nucleotidyltransferase [Aerococcaceae bacterium NML190073]MCW6666064.1 sugar phosphate nucleotidyltransferase [Aerococcaceae bacterium NML190938]MCW6676234.1 sugar phosphate nucleotidyltransferase [Aerococcaceae bacterium NML180378]MCW6681954.1 sugar phosphate nucleotidyltransferase [Aerococcaceae bacterium NML160702]